MVIEEEKTEEEGEWGTTLGFSTTERRFTLGWHRGLFLAAQVAQAQAIAGRLGTSFKL